MKNSRNFITPKIDYMMKIGEMDIDNALESFGSRTRGRIERTMREYQKTKELPVFAI